MGQTEYTTAVLADSPMAFYKLNDASGFPQDSSGNARHMTSLLGTAPTYSVAGPFTGSNGISYTALSGVASTHQIDVFSTAVENMTFEMWYNSLLGLGVYNGALANGGFAVSEGAGIENRILVRHGGNVITGRTMANWFHVVGTKGVGADWKLYLDGDLYEVETSTGNPSTPTGKFAIGKFQIDGNSQVSLLSNVAYYESVLSDTRVRAHYEAGIGFIRKSISIPSPWRLA